MSTLQDRGMFASRKRRAVHTDGLKEGGKRPFVPNRPWEAPSGSSKFPESKPTAAGALADSASRKAHVQEAIHKEVQYKREGSKGVPENTLKVFRFVTRNFIVRDDFEKSHEFGPLSGVSHELRVVSAYMAGQLQKRWTYAPGKMCLECGKSGHFPRHCPSVLLE